MHWKLGHRVLQCKPPTPHDKQISEKINTRQDVMSDMPISTQFHQQNNKQLDKKDASLATDLQLQIFTEAYKNLEATTNINENNDISKRHQDCNSVNKIILMVEFYCHKIWSITMKQEHK